MAKSKKRIAETENQPSLFDLLTKELDTKPAAPAEGSANITERLRLAVANALNHPTKSRWNIAGEMSHLLGIEISKYQLDGWAAESKAHRIPVDYAAAFCLATENLELFNIIAASLNVFVMPGIDALRCEIQRKAEEARKIMAEKKNSEMLLRELQKRGAKQ